MCLLIIPLLDVMFGIGDGIRNELKGRIVFSVIDDTFATTEYLEVREKDGVLNATYEFSAAGFGETEKADAVKEGDSVLVISLRDRSLVQRFTIDKLNNQIKKNGKHSSYRVMENKLFQ